VPYNFPVIEERRPGSSWLVRGRTSSAALSSAWDVNASSDAYKGAVVPTVAGAVFLIAH
jgi:hypothetical protein